MILNKVLAKHYLEVFLNGNNGTSVEKYMFDGVNYSTQAQKNSLVTMLYQNYTEERELSTIQVIFRFDSANLRIFSSLNYDDGTEGFYGVGFYDSNSGSQNFAGRLVHNEGVASEQVVWSEPVYKHTTNIAFNENQYSSIGTRLKGTGLALRDETGYSLSEGSLSITGLSNSPSTYSNIETMFRGLSQAGSGLNIISTTFYVMSSGSADTDMYTSCAVEFVRFYDGEEDVDGGYINVIGPNASARLTASDFDASYTERVSYGYN